VACQGELSVFQIFLLALWGIIFLSIIHHDGVTRHHAWVMTHLPIIAMAISCCYLRPSYSRR
jgi:hypothetical protein